MIEVKTRYKPGTVDNDDLIQKTVGRPLDFGGRGYGWRDLGWRAKDQIEADAIVHRLSAIGFREIWVSDPIEAEL